VVNIQPFRYWGVAGVLCVVWVVSLFGMVYSETVSALALIPRSTDQWWGIATMALVHKDITHLLTNTTPLLFFLILLQTKGNRTFVATLSLCTLLGGIGLWAFGRSGAHIGASGLVFALFGFLICNGLITRRIKDLMIGLVVILSYWGLVGGLLPNDPQISWEGHVSGLIAGLLTSTLVSRRVVAAEEH